MLAGAATAVAFASSANAADLLKPADQIYSSLLFNFEGLLPLARKPAVRHRLQLGRRRRRLELRGDQRHHHGRRVPGRRLFRSWRHGIRRFGVRSASAGSSPTTCCFTGDLGLGLVDTTPVYAIGGAAEMGLSNSTSVRGDLQFLGQWGASPSATRATVGLMAHELIGNAGLASRSASRSARVFCPSPRFVAVLQHL